MLDHAPTSYEIAMAEQDFMLGHASCEQMEILRFAHPWRDYGDCPCPSDLFNAIFGSSAWPF